MGNAQSQQQEGPNPTSPQGPRDRSYHPHFPGRRPPQRKNSLSAATPLKAAPTTSTTQDHELLLNSDIHCARGTTTPSSITATEKLLDLSNSATPSSESSPPRPADIPSGSVPKPVQDGIAEKLNAIASVEVPAPSRRRNSFGSATTVDTVDLDEMNIDDTKAIPT